jgi:hypothetical protein
MATPMATTPATLTVDGITYDVISARTFDVDLFNGTKAQRVCYRLKRPSGRRTYVVFGYENGSISSVTPWGLAPV